VQGLAKALQPETETTLEDSIATFLWKLHAEAQLLPGREAHILLGRQSDAKGRVVTTSLASDRRPRADNDSARPLVEENDNAVLPQLSGEQLQSLIKNLSLSTLFKAHGLRQLPLPDGTVAVIGKHEAQHLASGVSAWIEPETFRAELTRLRRHELVDQALWRLENLYPQASARRRFGDKQVFILFLLAPIMALISSLFPGHLLFIASLVTGLFFTGLVALRMLCLLPQKLAVRNKTRPLRDKDLPTYTVLVPVFRETTVLRQLFSALNALAYPVDKLDIKIIVEERDSPMHAALAEIALPRHFEIIIVPHGKPQTKPRALNHALPFARGSLLTIYDAEDIPEPNQLRLAAETFASSPMIACLQARLAFFNSNENWLTRQFASEYGSLFGVLLPGLAAQGLPLPLGGTSNHFRISALHNVGAWDAFNVTEDADLGFRLARQSYRVAALDSTTWEEANTNFANWMRQRRRWLKGFLQTWLVHMRRPRHLWHILRWDGFMAFQALSLGVFLTSLLHPLLLVATVWHFWSGSAESQMQHPLLSIIVGLSLAILITGYGTAMLMARRGLDQIGQPPSTMTLLTIPFYWLMMCPAAILALWDFIVSPHHWHKTEHGLSRFQAGQQN
jgi:glycosyltransferase XagB